MKKIHGLFIVTVLVIVTLAYIAGYWQASSFFTDINDVLEVTHCDKPTVDECEMPVPLLAWYFAKFHLYMLLPSTLIGWMLVMLGWRKNVLLGLTIFPFLVAIVFPLIRAIYLLDFDISNLGKAMGMVLIGYGIPMLMIGYLHFLIGINLQEFE